jgi:hypothetical protein
MHHGTVGEAQFGAAAGSGGDDAAGGKAVSNLQWVGLLISACGYQDFTPYIKHGYGCRLQF